MTQLRQGILAQKSTGQPVGGVGDKERDTFLHRDFHEVRQPEIHSTLCVEESNPAPHIHERMTTSNYGYDIAYNFTHSNIMLEHNVMNNKNTVAHMDVHNTQY